MPYKIEYEPRGVVVHWSGVATGQEAQSYLNDLQSDYRFEGLKYAVHDYRSCEAVRFDRGDAELIAAYDYAGAQSRFGTAIRVAIVSESPDLMEQVIAYAQCGLSPNPIMMFSDMDHALEWAHQL